MLLQFARGNSKRTWDLNQGLLFSIEIPFLLFYPLFGTVFVVVLFFIEREKS